MGTWTFHTLTRASQATLEELMKASSGPALDAIAGWEFRGWNVLTQPGRAVMAALGNLRFIKFFHEASGGCEGGNFKVARGGAEAPWKAVPSDAQPAVNGVYTVHAPGESARGADYPTAVFLDYDRPENNLFSGRYLRDFLVQPDADNPDLLLGKAFMELGPLRSGGYFVLERLQPLRDSRR